MRVPVFFGGGSQTHVAGGVKVLDHLGGTDAGLDGPHEDQLIIVDFCEFSFIVFTCLSNLFTCNDPLGPVEGAVSVSELLTLGFVRVTCWI